MKMRDIVDSVSDLYRSERDKVNELRSKVKEVHCKLGEAEQEEFENISYAEYGRLISEMKSLDKEIGDRTSYCDGISRARELLMSLCFETEIEK